MINKTRKIENKKRISKRFESQRPVRNIEEVLADMDETARGIMRYGVENAEIADLMSQAEQNLDADYWEADKEGDEETKKAIEDEMERMENEATECCGKIIDAIDSVWPVSELTPAQKQRLGWELEDLKAYDTRAMEDPNTFVKLIVAEYALSEDNGLLEALEFACQNALDEEDEEMDESVKKNSKPFKKESKKHSVCESALSLSDMDGDVRQWAVDHIVDRLDEMEGMEVELNDLAHELVDRESIDGGVFYNNHQAWEWVANHRYDAGDVLAMMCNEWGTCSPNPLIDPDAFCVVFLQEAIADILEDSATVQDGGKVELTREVIDAIIEEIQ